MLCFMLGPVRKSTTYQQYVLASTNSAGRNSRHVSLLFLPSNSNPITIVSSIDFFLLHTKRSMFDAHDNDFHCSQFDAFIRTQAARTNAEKHQRLEDRLVFEDNFSVEVEGGNLDDWWPAAYAEIVYDSDGAIICLSFYHCTFQHLPISLQSLKHLRKLEFHSLVNLETSIDNQTLAKLQRLETIKFSGCFAMHKLPALPIDLASLSIESCHGITSSQQDELPPNLQSLIISNMIFPNVTKLPSSLNELYISGSQFDSALFSKNIEGHSNIRLLRLSMCDLDEGDLAAVWSIIPSCKSLTSLNVSGNRIATLNVAAITKGKPTRLRALNLEANPVVNSLDPRDEKALARILDFNQELCCIGSKGMRWPLVLGLEQALDYNFARVLLNQQKIRRGLAVPMSLWPAAIAKMNSQPHKDDARKANMIHDVLLGPAFSGRSPHTYSSR